MKPCGARCDYKEWYWIIYESNFFILIDWVRVFVANTEYWRAQWSCDTLKPTAGWPQGPNHRTSLATLSAAGMGLTMTMSGSPSLSTWSQVRWTIGIHWEEFHVIFDWDIFKYTKYRNSEDDGCEPMKGPRSEPQMMSMHEEHKKIEVSRR